MLLPVNVVCTVSFTDHRVHFFYTGGKSSSKNRYALKSFWSIMCQIILCEVSFFNGYYRWTFCVWFHSWIIASTNAPATGVRYGSSHPLFYAGGTSSLFIEIIFRCWSFCKSEVSSYGESTAAKSRSRGIHDSNRNVNRRLPNIKSKSFCRIWSCVRVFESMKCDQKKNGGPPPETLLPPVWKTVDRPQASFKL